MDGKRIYVLFFIVLTVLSIAAVPILETVSETKVIWAKALDDHSCSESEWHFVITQVSEESLAPSKITVTWANGDSKDVPLEKFTGGTAHYTTYDNLNSTVTSASAVIYSGWDGQFNLSHGPCNEEPTPTPTTPEPTPTQPEPTPTETQEPTPTGTLPEPTPTKPEPTPTGTLPEPTTTATATQPQPTPTSTLPPEPTPTSTETEEPTPTTPEPTPTQPTPTEPTPTQPTPTEPTPTLTATKKETPTPEVTPTPTEPKPGGGVPKSRNTVAEQNIARGVTFSLFTTFIVLMVVTVASTVRYYSKR